MISPLATHLNNFTRRGRYQVSNYSYEIRLPLHSYLGNGVTGFIVRIDDSFNLTLEKHVHGYTNFGATDL